MLWLALSTASHLLSTRSSKQLYISCQHRPPAFQDQAMQRSKNSPELSTTPSVRAKLPPSWRQTAVRAGIAVFMSSLLVASTPDPRQSQEQLLVAWVILAPPPPCHQLSPSFSYTANAFPPFLSSITKPGHEDRAPGGCRWGQWSADSSGTEASLTHLSRGTCVREPVPW